MPTRKIVAVTNVKLGQEEEDFFAAGDPIDRSKFTDKQLKQLHDDGAIEVRLVEDTPTEEISIDDLMNEEADEREKAKADAAKAEVDAAKEKLEAAEEAAKADADAAKVADEAKKPEPATPAKSTAAPAKSTTPSK